MQNWQWRATIAITRAAGSKQMACTHKIILQFYIDVIPYLANV